MANGQKLHVVTGSDEPFEMADELSIVLFNCVGQLSLQPEDVALDFLPVHPWFGFILGGVRMLGFQPRAHDFVLTAFPAILATVVC